MALATFYHPSLEEIDTTAVLSADESAHAIKSRRLRSGSIIQLINGRGLIAQAEIVKAGNREVSVQLKSAEKTARPNSLAIATAIPKGDRQRTMIDMLTQLGVAEIIPLRCEHSVAQFKTSMLDKWQRLAIAACKQSQNPWLPIISPELSLQEVLSKSKTSFIYADRNGQSILSLQDNIASNITVLVGPEGGFSEPELGLLTESCVPVNLGMNILRTELAAVTAVAQARIIMKYI